jgi:putative transposase
MADQDVVCSMSRSGYVWDNAAMESFLSSPKTERIARKTYRTRDEAKPDVFNYIKLLQSERPTLDERISEPSRVRKADQVSLGC